MGQKIRVTKIFRFEMAHALWNYSGDCRHLHGHSYVLYVTLSGEPDSDPDSDSFGMVMDFKDLKSLVKQPIVDHLDHSLVLYRAAEGPLTASMKEQYEKIHIVDFQPTCENLVLYMAEKISANLPDHIQLQALKLYETATSLAEWYASDNC